MAKSFVKRILEFKFVLSDGDFGGGNTLTVRGLGSKVTVEKPGLPDKNSASIDIVGLSYEHMAELTTLSFKANEMQKNLVTVSAGDDERMTVIFEGEITSAWPDFNSVPDVKMVIEAESGAYPQRMAEPPMSVNGTAAAASLIEQEAVAMGYSFKNEGCSASIKNAVFEGSPMEKMQKMASQVGAKLIVDDREVILLPDHETARSGNAVLLSKDTGLVGYPTFSSDGIQCKCLFNPDLAQGGMVKVESVVPKASGLWMITKLSHDLSAYTDGAWLSEIEAEYGSE
jgi:hypothetical protein